MENCKFKEIPGQAGTYFSINDCPLPEEVDSILRNKFRMLIGSLLFMANYWRPDIMFMVSHLARFAHIPSQKIMDGALRILNYLKYTKELGLIYYRNNKFNSINPIIICHTDSNFAGDSDAISTAGMFIQMIDKSDITDINRIRPIGNVISYFSKRQPKVAVSTAFAEFIGLWMASSRVFTILESMIQLGFNQLEDGVPFYCDSQATINALLNNKLGKMKLHMSTKFNSLRASIIQKELNLMYVPTEENTSDMLTKPLTSTIFMPFRDQLMSGALSPYVRVASSKKRKLKYIEF